MSITDRKAAVNARREQWRTSTTCATLLFALLALSLGVGRLVGRIRLRVARTGNETSRHANSPTAIPARIGRKVNSERNSSAQISITNVSNLSNRTGTWMRLYTPRRFVATLHASSSASDSPDASAGASRPSSRRV